MLLQSAGAGLITRRYSDVGARAEVIEMHIAD